MPRAAQKVWLGGRRGPVQAGAGRCGPVRAGAGRCGPVHSPRALASGAVVRPDKSAGDPLRLQIALAGERAFERVAWIRAAGDQLGPRMLQLAQKG